ncbi:WAS/WASL-interacting protein family member 2-like isoform X2 [Narcine bancroftii]|uniref:WAS/WASL-interacting protein family member 2-like isoform X2 n=1 Tax=Narcine bancroftii TaxID=1343680 RepID=UPI00383169DB
MFISTVSGFPDLPLLIATGEYFGGFNDRKGMPVPTPPPPPGAPPLPSLFAVHEELPKHLQDDAEGRCALFKDIHKGVRLKKVTQINDRSGPIFDKPKSRNNTEAKCGAATPTVTGGLFQGGFPVLRPTGQRETSDRISKPPLAYFGTKTQVPRHPVQNNSDRIDRSSSNHSNCPEQTDISKVQRGPQGRLNASALVPPSLPLMSSCQGKSPLLCPSPTPSHSFNKPAKSAPSQGPPPPSVKPAKFQYMQPLPTLIPPPPPPDHFQDPTSDFSFPAPPPPLFCMEDCTDFPLPPPPPSPSSVPYGRAESPLPPPPPPPLLSNLEVPPPLPPKLPIFSNRPNANGMSPLPPPPPSILPYGHLGTSSSSGQLSYTTQLFAREVPSRSGVHNGDEKLASSPLPPFRSSSTEVTSRNQHSSSSNRTPTYTVLPPPPPPLPKKNRQGLTSAQLPVYADDFESKYNFHSVEDLPPPDEYKSFPRIYPSKQLRASQKGHRTITTLR